MDCLFHVVIAVYCSASLHQCSVLSVFSTDMLYAVESMHDRCRGIVLLSCAMYINYTLFDVCGHSDVEHVTH